MFDKFHKYRIKIQLGDFSAKIGRKDISKPTIGNASLHGISNDNRIREVSFATSNNLAFRSKMFPHRIIHKHTWTTPDGKTNN
jgi:hypothetical protein